MATGVPLSKLVKDLRAECGHSLSVAQGSASEETLRYIIARTQEELWYGYEWPSLKIYRSIIPQAGQRYYNYPADIPFERVTTIWAHTQGSSDWRLLQKGISPANYTVYDSNEGVAAWPPSLWDHNVDTDQIELWPIPSENTGELYVYGSLPLAPLLTAQDKCTLDGTVIVLFAAVEVLAKTSADEAGMKMQKAQRHLQRVLGAQGSRKSAWTSLSGSSGGSRGTLGLDYIPQGYRYPGQVT